MTPPSVGAVVVTYESQDHIRRTVADLLAAGADRVVVVDNSSTDDTVERAEAAGAHVVRTGANLGFGAAANRGVLRLATDVVVIANPDIELTEGALDRLAATLAAEPDAAVVGPRVENLDGTRYPSARSFPAVTDALGHAFLAPVAPRNRFTRRYRLDHVEAGPVDWVSGTFMVVDRADYLAVGGFDEGYFMYVEDVDLCWRLARAGRRTLYEPDAVVRHVIGASSDRHPYRMIVAHHRSLWLFATRTLSGPKRALLPLVGVGLALRVPVAWIQHRARGRPHAAA